MRPLLLLFALATLPYAPGVFHDFVYDDHGALVENRFWSDPAAWRRVLTLETIRDPRVLDGQRPTLLLSVLIDRALGAREAWQFRLSNLAIHAACALLLYAWLAGVLRRAGEPGARAGAFFAGLLFAVHPLASEAVQVPSFREDLLALCGVLAALALSPVRRAAIRVPLQLAAAALALGAKESAVALPFLLALTWWCFPVERPAPGRMRAELLAGLALGVAWFAVVFTARPAQALRAEWNGLALQPPENFWTAPGLFAQYLKLLVAPWPLCADRIVAPVSTPVSFAFMLPLALAVALAALGLLARRRAPLVALGIGWLFIAFAPVSNLIPLFNPFADRYAYAMIPGFAALAAALPPSDPIVRRGLIAMAVVYVLLLQLRLPDWRNDETLWAATLRVEPRSARAHTGLGLAALARGDTEAAAGFFARADALNPRDVSALVNLAILDGRAGDHAAAAARLEEAVRRRPDKPEAWANLAVAYELLGRRVEALHAAARAKETDPLGRY
jgi:tetratricopeptide (TPR) repeat protein